MYIGHLEGWGEGIEFRGGRYFYFEDLRGWDSGGVLCSVSFGPRDVNNRFEGNQGSTDSTLKYFKMDQRIAYINGSRGCL
jgi:hypothetical protein